MMILKICLLYYFSSRLASRATLGEMKTFVFARKFDMFFGGFSIQSSQIIDLKITMDAWSFVLTLIYTLGNKSITASTGRFRRCCGSKVIAYRFHKTNHVLRAHFALPS
jgi:hypothetical protein